MSSYLQTTKDVYKQAALAPDKGLCCTSTPIWQLPELTIPKIMLEMNYGCGSTIHPRDLVNHPAVLYVGIGGGMELLQFAYFSRRKAAIIGIDPVSEMLHVCKRNLELAQQQNAWFKKDFVDIRQGDALALPIADASIDVAAQNCLFNIFESHDLDTAIQEMYRVLKPHGRLVLSDPVCNMVMPDSLRNNQTLRALCLSGAIPLNDYINRLTSAGFGTIEIRAKRPYRILDTEHYDIDKPVYIESVEVCAIKDPIPADGPCVFTGKTAIYTGKQEIFDDGKGHIMTYNQPLSICDKTASALQQLKRRDLFISDSTYFYDGGGCC